MQCIWNVELCSSSSNRLGITYGSVGFGTSGLHTSIGVEQSLRADCMWKWNNYLHTFYFMRKERVIYTSTQKTELPRTNICRNLKIFLSINLTNWILFVDIVIFQNSDFHSNLSEKKIFFWIMTLNLYIYFVYWVFTWPFEKKLTLIENKIILYWCFFTIFYHFLFLKMLTYLIHFYWYKLPVFLTLHHL